MHKLCNDTTTQVHNVLFVTVRQIALKAQVQGLLFSEGPAVIRQHQSLVLTEKRLTLCKNYLRYVLGGKEIVNFIIRQVVGFVFPLL